MKENGIQWFAGERDIQKCVTNAAFQTATVLHTSPHRTIHRVFMNDATDTAGEPHSKDLSMSTPSIVVKIHRLASGRHPVRDRTKQWLGFSPARREWKALEALFAVGASVPAPRAWGRLANGDEIVVTDFVAGDPLVSIEMNLGERRELITALADAIKKIHNAGYRHGDLHLGNLMRAEKEVVVLDLQRARRQLRPDDRLWDLARLEFSLTGAGWDSDSRKTLRDRLGVGDAFDPVLRRFLRDHVRGRTRRMLQLDQNWSRARVGPFRGMRDVSLEADSLAAVVASARNATPTHERRNGRVQIIEIASHTALHNDHIILVKQIGAGSLRRAIGDRLRGTAAARAFHAGQASRLLSNRAARPLAFLEKRRFGLPVQSLLVLEKVGEDDLDRVRPTSPESERRLACALGEWLAEGHAWGLSHRDCKATNIRVTIEADSIRFWMIDLEDLRGPIELSDEARLGALIQLNASLEDEAMSVYARLAALESYENRIPFRPGKRSPARIIAQGSLVRAHRWRNNDGACHIR